MIKYASYVCMTYVHMYIHTYRYILDRFKAQETNGKSINKSEDGSKQTVKNIHFMLVEQI